MLTNKKYTSHSMEFFSCNDCKRCWRRTPSSGDSDVQRRRYNTNLRRKRITSDCCAAAAMYFYAAQRRQRQPEVDVAPLERSELTVSTGSSGTRASILKKSDESPISVSTGRRSPCVGDKRASFNEAVDVIVADDSGRPVVADSVRLKRSPEVDNSAVVHATTNSAAGQRRAKQAFAEMVFPPTSRCRHAFQLASTDVQRRPDGSRYLRAVIRPAADHDGNSVNDGRQTTSCDERVVVRAAGRGSRLVVGAYRPEPLGDGTNYLRQVRSVSKASCRYQPPSRHSESWYCFKRICLSVCVCVCVNIKKLF